MSKGIHIGTASGNVTINKAGGDLIQAGGDVVYGDKITTTSTTYHGFQQEADKAQFLAELDNLRAALRTIKSAVEAAAEKDQDARDLLSANLSQQILALNDLKTQAAALPVAHAATPQQTTTVTECLKTTSELLNKAQTFGEKAAEIGLKLLPAVTALAALFGVVL